MGAAYLPLDTETPFVRVNTILQDSKPIRIIPNSHSGHETRQSLEVYPKLSLTDAQEMYNEKTDKFPI